MVTQMMSRNWRDLIRPKAITLDPESNSESYGKFTCEPLERGFGVTIGNSLRRVLLASLQGAAITAVRLESALHEFTTIPRRRRGRDRHHPQPQRGGVQGRLAQDVHGAPRERGPRPDPRQRHQDRRWSLGAEPDPSDRDPRQEGTVLGRTHGGLRPRLRFGRAQQEPDHAARHDPDRCPVQPRSAR